MKYIAIAAVAASMFTGTAHAAVGDYFSGANGGIRYIDAQTLNDDGSTSFTIRTVRANGTVRVREFTVSADGDVSGNSQGGFKDWLRAQAAPVSFDAPMTDNEIAYNAWAESVGSTDPYTADAAAFDWVGIAERIGIEVDYTQEEEVIMPAFDLTEGVASSAYAESNYGFLNVNGLQSVHSEGWTGEGAFVVIKDFFSGPNAIHGRIVSDIAKGVAPGARVHETSNAIWLTNEVDLNAVDIYSYSASQDYRLDFNDEVEARARYDVGDYESLAFRIPNANIVKAAGNNGGNIFQVGDYFTASYNDYCVKEGGHHTADSCSELKYFYDNLDGTLAEEFPEYAAHLERYTGSHFKSALDTQDQLIVVGASHDGVTLADYSASAGRRAMNDFIVADGRCGQGYNGTSCAAPRVSGALALVKHKFPNLDAKDRKDLILSTADDLGVAGVDPVFGHGLLNVGRALSPMGNLN